MVRIHIGSRGTQIRTLQGLLNARGYGPLKADGVFGPLTDQAVRQFQAAQGLQVDGVAGLATWSELGVHGLPAALESWTKKVVGNSPAAKAVKAATADIGKRESPMGSNAGPEIGHLVNGYAEHWRIAGAPRYPWCAMAVSVWTASALGLGARGQGVDWPRHPFGAWLGSVAMIEDWATGRDRYSTDWTACVPGSIFTMARGGSSSDPGGNSRAGHCGIVLSVDIEAGTCQTVDGNVSNRVSVKTRSLGSLRGHVRWWPDVRRSRRGKTATNAGDEPRNVD